MVQHEFWSVPKLWTGETVAILASGPSLTRQQVNYVRGRCRVIAVNNQGIPTARDGVPQEAMAPWADVLYAADRAWWHVNRRHASKFAGLKVSIRDIEEMPDDVKVLQVSTDSSGFDDRPTHLVTGKNSGYQAIHLAAHFGAARILLLGFDMRKSGDRVHWFGNHPPQLCNTHDYARWLSYFPKLAHALAMRNVQVINCTPGSAIDCFTKETLECVI